MDSGALPTQSSMILWFFRGRQRPALHENKQTTWKRIPPFDIFLFMFGYSLADCFLADFVVIQLGSLVFFFFRNMERWNWTTRYADHATCSFQRPKKYIICSLERHTQRHFYYGKESEMSISQEWRFLIPLTMGEHECLAVVPFWLRAFKIIRIPLWKSSPILLKRLSQNYGAITAVFTKIKRKTKRNKCANTCLMFVYPHVSFVFRAKITYRFHYRIVQNVLIF